MSEQPRLCAVAFDLDGLMFNTEDLYHQVGQELLARRGKQFTPELLNAMMGLPGNVSLQVMIDWHQLDATVDQLNAETDDIFPRILEEQLAPMPGLLPLLDALEQSAIPKAIVTSSRRDYVDRVLRISGLTGRFAFILTAQDVQHGKPAPDIYLAAAERFGVPPGAMMVLEDSENGARSAVTAGTYAVAVPGDHSRDHDFTGAQFLADGLTDARIYQSLQLAVDTPSS